MATLETAGSWAITASDGTSHGHEQRGHGHAGRRLELVFAVQPAARAGATIAGAGGQPVTVDVEDAYGNLVTS